MAASPAHPIPTIGPTDVIERLSRCERLLTAKELGEILAISPKTLYNYVTRGMIPYFKIESNVRFRGRDVAEWLRQHSSADSVIWPENKPAPRRHASR
jgi:excisionase family DNA binding protein